jgi:hypothetical protein
MKTVTKTLDIYSIEDVKNNEELKELVLEKNRDINVDNNYWFDDGIEAWKERLREYGFIEPDIQFSGFWSQGDGASFTSKAVYLDLYLKAFGRDLYFDKQIKLFLDLIESYDVVEFGVERRDYRYVHEYTTKVYYDEYLYQFNRCPRLQRFLSNFITDLCTHMQDKIEELNRKIYKDLNAEYDYLESDEAVMETLEVNEYEFTEDGRIY